MINKVHLQLKKLEKQVSDNNEALQSLMLKNKLTFSTVEFKKRAYAGARPNERPYIEKMWNAAFKEDIGVSRPYLGKFGVNEFD